MKQSKAKIKMGVFNWVIFSILIIYTLSMIILFAWGFITSLKTITDFNDNKVGLPTDGWAWENYVTVFNNFKIRQGLRTYGVGEMLFNSIFYCCLFFF